MTTSSGQALNCHGSEITLNQIRRNGASDACAWRAAMENMRDYEDDILRFLITLAEMRRQTEITFLMVKQFVRPGFDD